MYLLLLHIYVTIEGNSDISHVMIWILKYYCLNVYFVFITMHTQMFDKISRCSVIALRLCVCVSDVGGWITPTNMY